MQESQSEPIALKKQTLRSVVWTFTALTLCVPVLPACVPFIVDDTVVVAPSAPPPLRAETRPRKPGHRHAWVDGRWRWNARAARYVWSPGKWQRIRHRQHRHWVRGRWVKTPRGWHWSAGHWR